MPSITASAPGKVILFGEHAVVYHRPAIAVPVVQVRARAVVSPDPRRAPGEIYLLAPDVGQQAALQDLPASDPLAQALQGVLTVLDVKRPPACTIKITSTIPVASGLGSGAAVSVALIRAFSAFLGQPLPLETVNELAYEVEKLHHGSPSGIDNTVITYGMPVYFVRGQALETFQVQSPFQLVIADTGISSPTLKAVGEVRAAWQAQRERFEGLFDGAARLANLGRAAIESGRWQDLGPLMDENHTLLQAMGVSSPELDRLVLAARQAGALGAKLSGGGQGGNMIAVVPPDRIQAVALELKRQGAVQTLITEVG